LPQYLEEAHKHFFFCSAFLSPPFTAIESVSNFRIFNKVMTGLLLLTVNGQFLQKLFVSRFPINARIWAEIPAHWYISHVFYSSEPCN